MYVYACVMIQRSTLTSNRCPPSPHAARLQLMPFDRLRNRRVSRDGVVGSVTSEVRRYGPVHEVAVEHPLLFRLVAPAPAADRDDATGSDVTQHGSERSWDDSDTAAGATEDSYDSDFSEYGIEY